MKLIASLAAIALEGVEREQLLLLLDARASDFYATGGRLGLDDFVALDPLEVEAFKRAWARAEAHRRAADGAAAQTPEGAARALSAVDDGAALEAHVARADHSALVAFAAEGAAQLGAKAVLVEGETS